MTKIDTIVLVAALIGSFTLWLFKAVTHFDYLKQEKHKLKRSDNLPELVFSMVFRPIYWLDHLGDIITILYLPILWNIGSSKYRQRIALICYGFISLWTIVIGYYAVQNATNR